MQAAGEHNRHTDVQANEPSPIVMGDYGDSAPDQWWHKQFETSAIHMMVQLSCKSDASRNAFTEAVRTVAVRAGVRELIPTANGAPMDGQYLDSGRLHFGYRDGIASPDVVWEDGTTDPKQTNFREFILGYSTPAISSTPKPVASRPATSARATALVTDGTYGVLKWIYQDVARFNAFLEAEAPKLAADATAADPQELLAAKLIGRWRDGTPPSALAERAAKRLSQQE
jgi:deferrochelatase/peroxidase EfeB